MSSIRFYAKPYTSGRILIMAAFEDGSNQVVYKSTKCKLPGTKIKGEYKHWDIHKHRARQVENEDEINEKILDWKTRFNRYKKDCKQFQKPINIKYFIKSLDQPSYIQEVIKGIPTLLDMAREFYNSTAGTHTQGTRKQYKTFIEDLELYQKKTGHIVQLGEVNKDFYMKFGLFLISENNNFNNTVNRKIGRIITIMGYAKQYINTSDWKTRFTFKSSEARRFALRPDEYQALLKYKPKSDFHQLVLDAFLFSCETALRFSDISELYPHNKTEVKDGKAIFNILDLSHVKTTNLNTLVLTDLAISIWNKYAKDSKKKVFDIKYSQSATDAIKAICKDAKLTRLCETVRTQGEKAIKEVKPLHDAIGYHMSRNTAITRQLAKLAPGTVMNNAGIKKMETVMTYFKDDELTRFRDTYTAMNKTPATGKKRGKTNN